MDKIEWPEWVEEITVYRDGKDGQFCCRAYVDDDAFWKMSFETEAIGWGNTIAEAIHQAFEAGNAMYGGTA